MSTEPETIPNQVRLLVILSIICLVAGVILAAYSAITIASLEDVEAKAETPTAEAPPPEPPKLKKEEVIELFHKIYYFSNTWKNMSWMGVTALQNPNDMWVVQEIIYETQPDYIIETGPFHGGGSLFPATILEAGGGEGKVLTIDIEPHVKEAKRSPLFKKRVEVLTGSSTDPELVGKIAERVKGKNVMVLLDSDHRRDHVYNELKAYAPMVGPGNYIVVQDSNLNGHPVLPEYGPGPQEALQDFLKENKDFEIDKTREKFLVSFFPNGYLKHKEQ
jgi:cephalosporin hydroxylase